MGIEENRLIVMYPTMIIWIFCSDTETGAVTPLGRGAEQILFGDDEYFSCFNCYISKE